MLILKILMFLFIIPGVFVVFMAPGMVRKYNLAAGVKVEFKDEMDEEQIKSYQFDKAVVNLKMLGMLIALPGFILAFIAFK